MDSRLAPVALNALRLMRYFVRIDHDNSIFAFEADVLAGNKSMPAVFERSGLPMTEGRDGGAMHVTRALHDLRA